MARIITKVFADIIRVYDTVTRLAYELDGTEWSAGLTASALTINSFGKQVGVIYTNQSLNLGNSIFGFTVPSNVPVELYNQSPGTSGSSSSPVAAGGAVSVASPAAFIASNPTTPQRAFIRQVGGTSPVFTGYKEAQGNLGFDSTAGAVNIINLFFDGVSYWYSIFGEVAATATPATQTLTSFAINAAGNLLSFVSTGSPLTALAGNITVAGQVRALTFVSATSASFTPVAYVGEVSTVSVTSSTPALTTTVTNAAVTNNSTVPVPTQTLTNFALNTTGTTLTFSNSGTALTAFNGTLTVAGSARALTFVSATSATITPAATTGQTVTVNLTSTTPAIPLAVTNLPVTNNSTVVAVALAKRAIVWANPPVVTATSSTDPAVTNVASFGGAGASVTTPIDTTQPFEVIFRSSRTADVFILDDAIATTWGWAPLASARIAGAYINGGVQIVSATQSQGLSTTGNQTAVNTYFKFRKSGNDIIMATSLDNATYVDAFTYAGALTGVPTLYSSVYNVSGAATTTPEVSYYA
jgi:hypothetical protein